MEHIEDAKLQRNYIEMEAITLDNIYKITQNFGELYAILCNKEKKSLVTNLIKEKINISKEGVKDALTHFRIY
ncbi:MAG: Site-specific recombinase, invertase Pin s [Anaerocolumna sp.]|nr:Site-specific recombinase, invertase Pin s [Anaerocolumna sp.]